MITIEFESDLAMRPREDGGKDVFWREGDTLYLLPIKTERNVLALVSALSTPNEDFVALVERQAARSKLDIVETKLRPVE